MVDIKRCNHTKPLCHCSGTSLFAFPVQGIFWMGAKLAKQLSVFSVLHHAKQTCVDTKIRSSSPEHIGHVCLSLLKYVRVLIQRDNTWLCHAASTPRPNARNRRDEAVP